jgi:hypothetical protein
MTSLSGMLIDFAMFSNRASKFLNLVQAYNSSRSATERRAWSRLPSSRWSSLTGSAAWSRAIDLTSSSTPEPSEHFSSTFRPLLTLLSFP